MRQERKDMKKEEEPIPEKMNAVIIEKYGTEEELKVVNDAPVPNFNEEANKDMVLVKVHCSSVNINDAKIRKGYLGIFFRPCFPLILGQDASGEVIKTGRDVKRFQVGDHVLGMKQLRTQKSPLSQGTYAQYVAFREHELAHKPSSISMVEAAAIPTAALASYQALTLAKLKVPDSSSYEQNESTKQSSHSTKKRVVMVGASGGVGSYAVQLAKKVYNAEVYAICSEKNRFYVKNELGADFAIPIHADLSSKNLPDVDVVLDMIGDDKYREMLWSKLKKKKGEYINVAIAEKELTLWDSIMQVGIRPALQKLIYWFGLGPSYRVLACKPNGEQLEQILKYHTQHHFVTHISRIFNGFGEIQSAHKILETRDYQGRMVLNCLNQSHLSVKSLIPSIPVPPNTSSIPLKPSEKQ